MKILYERASAEAASRVRLLAAVSTLAIGLASAAPVFAADIASEPTSTRAASVFDGTSVSVYGGFLFNGSGTVFGGVQGDSYLGNLSELGPGGDGNAFGFSVRHALDESWDWRLGVQANSFQSAGTQYSGDTSDSFASSDFDYQFADLEVGYHTTLADRADVRVFGGARILHAGSDIDYGYDGGSKLGDYHGDAHFWAAGPRVGVEGSLPMGNSPFLLNASLAGSALFTGGDADFAFTTIDTFSDPEGASSHALASTIWNAEASASIGYNFAPNAMVEVGYQLQQFWNLAPTLSDIARDGSHSAGHQDVLSHGPFLRLTARFP
jgi:hypothetical protein